MDVKGTQLSGEGNLLLHFLVFAKTGGAWQVTSKCHINFPVSQKCLGNVRTVEQRPSFFCLCLDLCTQSAASDTTTTPTTTITKQW